MSAYTPEALSEELVSLRVRVEKLSQTNINAPLGQEYAARCEMATQIGAIKARLDSLISDSLRLRQYMEIDAAAKVTP